MVGGDFSPTQLFLELW